MAKELFTIKKLFPRGEIENLVLARLFYQTTQLLEAVQLDKPKKDQISKYCMDNLVPKAIHCGRTVKELSEEADKQLRECRVTKTTIENMPHIIRLEERSGDFLYHAKNFLRDLTGILNQFFGTSFNEASQFFDPKDQGAGKIVEWATTAYGADSSLVKVISLNQEWIKEGVRKRNAFEHPGKKSGTIIITNFGIDKDAQLIPPTWTRDMVKNPVNLIFDLQDLFQSLLLFSEDLIAHSIEKNLRVPLLIGAIPEEQQDKDMPVRLKYFLKFEPST